MDLSMCAVLLPLVAALAIFAVAIYEHVTAAALSLPMAHGLTGLVIALPIIAFLNAVYLISSRHHTPAAAGGARRLAWKAAQYGHVKLPSLPAVLQLLQGMLSVVVATLLLANNIVGDTSSSSSAAPLLRCALETTWQRLWTTHDAEAMRRIQDALRCCGFNSVADRAWPFSRGPGSATCADSYGRTTACRVPWMRAAKHRASVELAVVFLVALFQVGTLVFRSVSRQTYNYAHGYEHGYEHGYAPVNGEQGVRRPLLQEAVAVDEEAAHEEGEQGQQEHDQSGPRLEPSGLQNEWAT